VCRWVPWTIRNYKLDELTSANALRSNLSFMFKQYAHIKNPKVVDVLIYKGREELEVSSLLGDHPFPYVNTRSWILLNKHRITSTLAENLKGTEFLGQEVDKRHYICVW